MIARSKSLHALEEFTRDKLPSAGIIAARINGQLQFLRDYLNEDASHFPYLEEADIREALAFAATLAQGRDIFLAS